MNVMRSIEFASVLNEKIFLLDKFCLAVNYARLSKTQELNKNAKVLACDFHSFDTILRVSRTKAIDYVIYILSWKRHQPSKYYATTRSSLYFLNTNKRDKHFPRYQQSARRFFRKMIRQHKNANTKHSKISHMWEPNKHEQTKHSVANPNGYNGFNANEQSNIATIKLWADERSHRTINKIESGPEAGNGTHSMRSTQFECHINLFLNSWICASFLFCCLVLFGLDRVFVVFAVHLMHLSQHIRKSLATQSKWCETNDEQNDRYCVCVCVCDLHRIRIQLVQIISIPLAKVVACAFFPILNQFSSLEMVIKLSVSGKSHKLYLLCFGVWAFGIE